MIDETHRVLLRACRRGDEAAARAFFMQLSPTLTAYARSVLRDTSLAEDAVQSAFCKVFQSSVREVDRVESPRAWMARIVRREALTMLRTARRMLARHERWRLEHGGDGGSPEPLRDELAEVGRHVESLPRAMREVVVLRHVCGLTFDQAATALGANRNTVASRYRAAIAKLQQLMSHRDAGKESREHAR